MDIKSAEFRARAEQRRATWTITRYDSLDARKAAEYAFWATQPTHVVMKTIAEMAADAYAMKGIHVSPYERTLVRVGRSSNKRCRAD